MKKEIQELKNKLAENELMIQALDSLIDEQRLVLERVRERLLAEVGKREK
jgi:uncharacterized coiled-coil protein SlyX